MASMCKCCKKNDERVHDVIQVREARLNLTPQTEQQQEDGEQQYGFLTRCLIYSILGGSVIIILVVALSVALTLESSKDLSKQRDKVPLNESLEWSEWEACSKPCGNGTRTRQLNCSTTTGPCDSSVFETQDCNTHVCPADYSPWGPWSSCSVTCGGGWQVRNRTCIVEVCSEDREENRVCNQQRCDFSPWGPWSSCSVTCEGGLQVRNRTCINQDCSGVKQENRVCNEQTCDFSQWSPWSSCSVTCGEGSQLRIRICRIQECSGISEENRACTQQPCEFSNWGPWSACTASCGGGCQLRNRTCIVQQCSGITKENRVCNEGSCEGNLRCSRETLNICSSYMKTWKVRELKPTYISLDRCNSDDLSGVSELLLLVGRSRDISDYGKYEVIKVNTCAARSCVVPLATPLSKLSSLSSTPCEIRAQRLTTFDNVTLMHWCTLTCHSQPGSFGNVLALRATSMLIDSTSQIDVTGKGFLGGLAGFNSGSGGYGGETYRCERGSIGEGGSGGQDGVGGGGAGDGFQSGGPGGYHAGGGGGVSATDNDGAGGGGGGGHFSGGGGGGSGNGCEGPGGKGGFAVQEIGRFAGGGGDEECPANDGRNNTLIPGGRDGTAERGGTGGDTRRGSSSGAAGGGGGFQYGSLDFENTLSYGGGGGGGGGSAFEDGNIGGFGGNGGGVVLLFLKTLTLNGKINANGEKGRCPYEMTTIKSGSGGSGAGGSVIIYTDVLYGDPSTKITVDGGPPNNDCMFGSGGGGGGGVGRWVIKTNNSVLTSGG